MRIVLGQFSGASSAVQPRQGKWLAFFLLQNDMFCPFGQTQKKISAFLLRPRRLGGLSQVRAILGSGNPPGLDIPGGRGSALDVLACLQGVPLSYPGAADERCRAERPRSSPPGETRRDVSRLPRGAPRLRAIRGGAKAALSQSCRSRCRTPLDVHAPRGPWLGGSAALRGQAWP